MSTCTRLVAGDLGVEIDEHGSRNVTGIVSGPSRPAVQIPAEVDDAKVVILEVPGKPAALDQRAERLCQACRGLFVCVPQ
jgi:hypothetical protein